MAEPSAPSPESSRAAADDHAEAPSATATATTAAAPIIRFDGVGKWFPGVRALDGITFDVQPGSCHALCGENGAGKSTLARVLAGIYAPDAGTIQVDGRGVRLDRPRDALAAGIALVHQELAACENLSVGENLCLGALPARGPFVAWREVQRRATAMLDAIGADIDVRRRVGELPVGQQQMVQIAAAVGSGARVIIFDEPTSSLSQVEAERLYALLGRLRARGVTCLYVSHRMPEIFRLCDRITVLRDGAHVATRPTEGLDETTLVQLMIGRRLEEYLPHHITGAPGPELLRAEDLRSPGKLRGVSLSVRSGEVVGLAGLVGAGRSEMAHALFGLDPEATGRVIVGGRAVRLSSPREAMRAGLGLVPEDRKRQGLVLGMRAAHNMTLPILDSPSRSDAPARSAAPSLSRAGFIDRAAEGELSRHFADRLGIGARGVGAVTAGLSGGNQQKIVLARWLAARCRVLILDEPTRGIDVGAKAEIHALIDRLAAEGNGVLLISSELPELIALSTRILVLREGALVGELARARASEEALLRLMAGVR